MEIGKKLSTYMKNFFKKKIVDKPYPLASQAIYNKKNKKKFIKVDWNEFPYKPCKNVLNKIRNSISSDTYNLNWYPNTYPKELINKISKYIKVSELNICLFAGSDSGLEQIAKTFIKSKNKVGILSPTYDQFRIECVLNDANLKLFFPKNIFNFKIEELIYELKIIKPTIFYICNPNNPTGNHFKRDEIIKMLKLFPRTLFIVDEAYSEYSGEESLANKYTLNKVKNLIIMKTFSKCFGLASLRLGYCISSKEIINTLNKYKNHKSINSIAQIAGIETLKNLSYYVKKIKIIQKTKYKFVSDLHKKKINVINTPANFVLLKTNKKMRLLRYMEQKGIYIRDLGHLKFMNDYVRISISTPENMNLIKKGLLNFFRVN